MSQQEKPVEKTEEGKETTAQKVADAIGSAMITMSLCGLVIIILAAQIDSFKKTGLEWLEKSKTPAGYVTGKVTKVKTWQEEDFQYKEGRMTLTLPIKDRCEITFSDGRTRKFIGMPKETVPTDKEMTFVWGGFDILLEVADAEEFKNRPNKPGDPPPENKK